MGKQPFTLEEVKNFIEVYRYPVSSQETNNARCIDGRYRGNDLAPLARPGGDFGSLMEIVAANESLQLGLSDEAIEKIMLSQTGGYEHFHIHSDTHHEKNAEGCGHIREAFHDPVSYELTDAGSTFLKNFFEQFEKKGGKMTVLDGEHGEGAVVIVKGNEWSIAPDGKAFIYHKTLDDGRRRRIAHAMASYVNPALSVDEQYLYDILTRIADVQRMETVRRLADSLPIYEAQFSKDGTATVSSFPK